MVLTIEPYFWLLQGCKASLPPWCMIRCASEENFIFRLSRRGGWNAPGKRCWNAVSPSGATSDIGVPGVNLSRGCNEAMRELLAPTPAAPPQHLSELLLVTDPTWSRGRKWNCFAVAAAEYSRWAVTTGGSARGAWNWCNLTHTTEQFSWLNGIYLNLHLAAQAIKAWGGLVCALSKVVPTLVIAKSLA